MMKKWMLAVLLLVLGNLAFSQTGSVAQKLMQEVGQKYNGYSKLKLDFSLKVTDKKQQNTFGDDGVAFLDLKADKYKVDMADQTIISDGKSQWSILKEEREVQLTEVDHNDQSISPANLFTFYDKGFKSTLAKDEKLGATVLKVVDLSPMDTKRQYSKIRLRINNATKEIYDATVFDKSGSMYTYTIKKLQTAANIGNEVFTYDKSKYPQYELVDLR
ncbi:LolA family protein [Olivibacter sitiensis]|uniref:LolA family protein n=1 Tax=Olivibacter sitiensis TaxID=376470 RepID=UPI001FDF4443|nr:outer membrane lipoprotein carrier protein LolA [Olivibacter sitiensis]